MPDDDKKIVYDFSGIDLWPVFWMVVVICLTILNVVD